MAQSFVRWLHQACLDDPEREKPYAGVYALGPQIENTIGLDGEFDMERLSVMIRERFGDSSEGHLTNLIRAEAVWRMETLDLDPEGEILTPELLPTICIHIGLEGSKCRNPCVPGAARCIEHGGTVLDPSVRRSMLLIAYAKMMQASSIAVESLVDVLENSNSALARVYAAREILDRVGLVHEDGAHQSGDDTGAETQDELMDALRGQLASARERLQLVAIPAESSDVDDDD